MCIKNTRIEMIEKEKAAGRYQQNDVRREGMSIALSPPGLECIAVWLRPLVEGSSDTFPGCFIAEGIAEWMHWQSYIMASGKSQRLKTVKQWRDWLEPQIRNGIIA